MSVWYVKKEEGNGNEKIVFFLSHCVPFQSFPNILRTFVPYLIFLKVQLNKFLYEAWKIRFMEREEQIVCLTVLIFNASPRCCAPLCLIWFLERWSCSSVCMESEKWIWYKSRNWLFCLTSLLCNASLIYCTPSSPIWLLLRRSVMSFFVKRERWR